MTHRKKGLIVLLLVALCAGGFDLKAGALSPASLLEELLAVESQLAAEQVRLASIQEEIARLEEEARRRSAEIAEMEKELQVQQDRTGQWLNCLYRRGPSSFLSFLLKAEDFGDFLVRYTLLSYIVRQGLDQIRRTEASLAAVAAGRAALEQSLSRLRTMRKEAAAAVVRLEHLRAQKEAALARARAQAAGDSQLEELLRRWQQGLPSLAYLAANFGRLPWSEMAPDRVEVNPRRFRVIAYLNQETVERTLTADPALAGLRLVFQPGAAVIAGPGYVLNAGLTVEGNRIRLVPRRLEVGGVELEGEPLEKLFAGYDLSFEFPSPDPRLKLSEIQLEAGRAALIMGPA